MAEEDALGRSIVVAVAALFAAAALPGLTLLRGPVVGRPNDTDVAISWITDSPSDSRVDYATERGDWTTIQDATPVTRHEIVIGGLPSGGLYRYQVFSDGAALADESTFRAPRGPGDVVFRFGVIGDTDGIEVPAEIADRLAESGVDLAIHTGDVVYPAGAEADYDVEFFGPMSKWLRLGPVLPTMGNHDAMTDRGAPMLADFVMPKNDATGDSRFYAFHHGNALFVCLDVETSQFGAGSPQYDWLERTLREATDTWKFVYFHTPAYSSATSNRVARLILSPLFESYGVDVVFAGHEHLYERTVPIRDFVRTGRGVVYVTEGGGGGNLTSFHPEEYSAYVATRFSYVVVDIAGPKLSLFAHDPAGPVFDSMEIDKSPPAVDRMPPVLLRRARPARPRPIPRE